MIILVPDHYNLYNHDWCDDQNPDDNLNDDHDHDEAGFKVDKKSRPVWLNSKLVLKESESPRCLFWTFQRQLYFLKKQRRSPVML